MNGLSKSFYLCMSPQAQFCMIYMQYVTTLGRWTWATTQPAVQMKMVGASTMTPGETRPAPKSFCFNMATVSVGHLYWDTYYINLELFLMITLHLPTYSVTPVSENQLQTNQAYVLFYQRSNSTTTARK